MAGPAFPIDRRGRTLLFALTCAVFICIAWSARAQIEPFVGSYSGTARLELADGSTRDRELSVEITQNRTGFTVEWAAVTFKADGSTTEKSYKIDFRPSGQNGLYAAAMKKDLFGNRVQLDPMKGEPYVWSQISGDTLTVYSLFVDAVGGYEIHQYDRTLADGGLDLEFNSVRNGEKQRTVSSFLERR